MSFILKGIHKDNKCNMNKALNFPRISLFHENHLEFSCNSWNLEFLSSLVVNNRMKNKKTESTPKQRSKRTSVTDGTDERG